MNSIRVRLLLFCFLGLSAACALQTHAFAAPENKPKLIVFHSPTCHACVEAKKEIIPQIEAEFKGRLEVEYRDITNAQDYMYLLSLKEKYNPSLEFRVPLFFLNGEFLANGPKLKEDIRALVAKSLKLSRREPELPLVNLTEHFRRFEPLAIIGIGLVDGVNPCAFTVIVFFISYLALQGYRRKELIPIGLAFISAVFLTYIAIGIGIFSFVYRLESFWLARKIFNICVGSLSVILGALAVYDFLKFRKTGETDGLILQLPPAVKRRIHYIIGLHYRKNAGQMPQAGTSNKRVFALIITAFFTGFLVSLIEAICTGQTYLPTIVFILKASEQKARALGYLLLYNFMFIAPLLIIFFLGLLGVTSAQFGGFLKKRLLLIKALMAILFFGIGIFLIWGA